MDEEIIIEEERRHFSPQREEVFDPYHENVVEPFFARVADERYETLQSHAD
jgi:hypothetical protein